MQKPILPAIASAAFMVASASAQDVAVTVDTWMLEHNKGAEQVYKNFERAVDRVCRKTTGRLHWVDRECTADLMDQLVVDINHPRIDRLHTGAAVRYAERDGNADNR
ncbi:UrcA family protein [Parvularcula lutaonensis]|uniref:UrcA family protein n=1 Tax=Parvularcula lutaonensis TaxID=491923 RepID=A0ABV7MC88_9PROT|nr:UrcA family protein [Parvularcula lutaonensis]GGY39463.1 hypothetical protein GCM10007148_04720 [Parvularcula lutaonensis]